MAALRFVTIAHEGIPSVHAVSCIGEYATLCGLDGYDESVGQTFMGDSETGKISCSDCAAIISFAKTYKKRDLHTRLQKEQA